ncbi:hypothetical protein Ccrd_005580 [Cynara cardunculus var. scolymus]|uniref:Uncharacterized protein n=1 Tax=Cynara cardunculus var. scolymus TaxID=59895 RepID=A0A103XKF1_CYNCS|nr:hypothetical protein Ccrd_005580 [Cynara cardunculus var. scolymus]
MTRVGSITRSATEALPESADVPCSSLTTVSPGDLGSSSCSNCVTGLWMSALGVVGLALNLCAYDFVSQDQLQKHSVSENATIGESPEITGKCEDEKSAYQLAPADSVSKARQAVVRSTTTAGTTLCSAFLQSSAVAWFSLNGGSISIDNSSFISDGSDSNLSDESSISSKYKFQ